jgi:hypothetical protein
MNELLDNSSVKLYHNYWLKSKKNKVKKYVIKRDTKRGAWCESLCTMCACIVF